MPEIRTIRVPQLGVNDQSARVVVWLVEDGGYCEKDEAVCEVETTKATIEIPAERSGIVLHLFRAGDELEIGQTIGLIGDNIELLRGEQEKHKKPTRDDARATDKARALAASLGIDLGQIQVAGIIREMDVVRFHGMSDKIPIAIDPTRLVIYGAGRGGINVLETANLNGGVACFVDDSPSSSELCGIPVYHSSRILELSGAGCYLIFIAIANGRKRIELLRQLGEKWKVINVIHPDSYIANSAKLGRGNHIKAGAVIDSNTTIGDCCIIDNNVTIPHDVTIGDGVHIAPGATFGSSITVGDYAIIGIGASITTGIKIGAGTLVGVGSAVTNDVADGDFVMGVPAQVVGHKDHYEIKRQKRQE